MQIFARATLCYDPMFALLGAGVKKLKQFRNINAPKFKISSWSPRRDDNIHRSRWNLAQKSRSVACYTSDLTSIGEKGCGAVPPESTSSVVRIKIQSAYLFTGDAHGVTRPRREKREIVAGKDQQQNHARPHKRTFPLIWIFFRFLENNNNLANRTNLNPTNRNRKQYKKLIRRWDSERELFTTSSTYTFTQCAPDNYSG